MKKAEQIEQFKVRKRLYTVEKWTLQKIADKFGVSRQAIHHQFRKAGIAMRLPRPSEKIFDHETLVKVYVDEKLNIRETAKRLNSNATSISKQLDRNGIEKRSSGFLNRKYPELYQIKIGESVLIKRPTTKKPYSTLYKRVKKIGIKISIKKIDNDTFQIYRKG